MTEFTLSVPVGQKVRREDGVKFVVEEWSRNVMGDIHLWGRDAAGNPQESELSSVTIVPEPGKLDWEIGDLLRPDYLVASSAFLPRGVYWGTRGKSLFLDESDSLWRLGHFSDPKAVAQEIEDVLARHAKEDARG